jgi:DNA-binding NtrC family response regulator
MARVLVVDDHAHVRGAVRRVLTRAGHQVWDVCDGTEALRLLEVVDFDLVITDVYMTAMDGMELLARAQQRGYRMPVVVMTGGGFAPREELLKMAEACGAFATIMKPFSPHQLRDTVSAVLLGAAA